MEDKDIKKMIQAIVPRSDHVILTRPQYFRAADPEMFYHLAESYDKPIEVVQELPKAIERAKAIARPDDLILICGSLFTVGEALSCIDPDRYRPDPI